MHKIRIINIYPLGAMNSSRLVNGERADPVGFEPMISGFLRRFVQTYIEVRLPLEPTFV